MRVGNKFIVIVTLGTIPKLDHQSTAKLRYQYDGYSSFISQLLAGA